MGIVIEVLGGLVQEVYHTDGASVDVTVIDFDMADTDQPFGKWKTSTLNIKDFPDTDIGKAYASVNNGEAKLSEEMADLSEVIES